MNEQAPIMNQQQMMNLNQPPQIMSMNQPQMMNPHQQQQQQQVISQINPKPSPMIPKFDMKKPQFMMNASGSGRPQLSSQSRVQIQQPASQMMGRSYGMFPPSYPPPPTMEQLKFQAPKPNPNPMKKTHGFVSGKQLNPLGPRSTWKGKKIDKRKDGGGRRKDKTVAASASAAGGSVGFGIGGGGGAGYKPPTLNELQHQNRLKARRFFPKKKFYNNNMGNNNRSAPFAPRNTSSFIIRAKRSGGIAELVSPCPVTPAVLPTPIFSPSREVLVDMAKEEWGVDGYGSMKGLIRLRSPGHEGDGHDEDEDDEGGSSESDVEEHVEVERRLDHDLSRFEMIYPNYGGAEYNNVLENRVDDQDSHIAQLEDENLILKERLFLMERELGDLRRRMQCLERHTHGGEEINEVVMDNESESESESHDESQSNSVENNEELAENFQGGNDMSMMEEQKENEQSILKQNQESDSLHDVKATEDGNFVKLIREDIEVVRGEVEAHHIGGEGRDENAEFDVKPEKKIDDADTKDANKTNVETFEIEITQADVGIAGNQAKDEAASNE